MARKLGLGALFLIAACRDQAAPGDGTRPAAGSAAIDAAAAIVRSADAAPTVRPADAAIGDVARPAAGTRPMYYASEITDAELDGRSLRELTIMRNTIFARAGHAFRKPWLRDYFTAQPWYAPLAQDDESKITAADRINTQRIAAREAAMPEAAMTAARDALLARAQRSAEEEVELELLVARVGSAAAPAGGDGGSAGAPGDGETTYAHLSDRMLTLDDLAAYSPRDLRLMRNEIYARHGRIFKSPLLAEYFSNTSWYHPDAGYRDDLLTAIETRNVRLIRSLEDSLGGPATDQDWFSAS